jgi:flagellin
MAAMNDIVLSRGVRSNLLNLQRTADNITDTQSRLATGKRVNTALDGPTNFFTSAALNSRAADLGSLLDSMSIATRTIETADTGIRSITRLIEQAQAVARQAINGTGSTGAPSLTGTNAGLLATTTMESLGFVADGSASITVEFDSNGADAGGTTTSTFALAAGATVQSFMTQVNTDLAAAGAGAVRAQLDNGRLVLRAANSGQTGRATLTVATTDASTALDNLGLGPANRTSIGSGTNFTLLENQFNELRVQIDQVARDSSFNGINLIQSSTSSLLVRFNEQGSSTLTIEGATLTSAGLGVQDISDANTNRWSTLSNVEATMSELSGALASLRSQASRLGSSLSTVQTRHDFTKSMINTLKVGADNLTLADQNEEAANLLALQTRQQLSQTALSLANQADQGVLRLFG